MDLVVERVIDGASAIPAEVIILYAWTKLLDMRDARVFWAVGLAYSCTMVLVRSSIDADIRPVVSVVLSLFYYFAFPLAFSRGKVVSRSFVCVAVFAIIMMAELMGGGLWVMMTGTLAGDNDAVPGHFAAFWFVRVVHLLILVTLFALLYRFVREIPSKAHQTGLEWFVGFPASQLLLLVALAFLGARLSFEGQADAFDVGKVLWGGGIVLSVLCLCADAFLFVTIDRHERRLIEERRMREMERQLAWRLAQYEDVACDIELTAHMRHDLKNQLEVVSILVERGECDLAREHLQSMAEHAASNTQDAAS